jgi:peroxiredoxin
MGGKPLWLRRGRLYLALLAMGYMVGVAVYPTHTEAKEKADVERAPEITMKRLDGKKASLSDYRGKWVFLNFWATWCPPCLQEMPEMEQFHKQFKSKMSMVAISVDKDDPAKIAAFVKDRGYTFEVFMDGDGESLSKFGESSIPVTYIINPSGDVVSRANGPRTWTDPVIVDYINNLMKTDGKGKTPHTAGFTPTKPTG